MRLDERRERCRPVLAGVGWLVRIVSLRLFLCGVFAPLPLPSPFERRPVGSPVTQCSSYKTLRSAPMSICVCVDTLCLCSLSPCGRAWACHLRRDATNSRLAWRPHPPAPPWCVRRATRVPPWEASVQLVHQRCPGQLSARRDASHVPPSHCSLPLWPLLAPSPALAIPPRWLHCFGFPPVCPFLRCLPPTVGALHGPVAHYSPPTAPTCQTTPSRTKPPRAASVPPTGRRALCAVGGRGPCRLVHPPLFPCQHPDC